MNEQAFFNGLVIGWFLLAVVVFTALFFVAAPYGRYSRRGWGPAVSDKLGWLIMESASPIVFAVCFILGTNTNTLTVFILLGLWEAHYIHRAFIYPFTHQGSKQMPIAIIGFALLFNTVNAYLNGRYIFSFATAYTNQWLSDPRFLIGLALFVTGFIINRQADTALHNMRRLGGSDYKILNSGLYRFISCPNYFGELIIWTGWAVATWSLVGLAFAVWTAANLVPRARSHHAWYRQHFPDYPPERKALVPLIW